MYSNGSLEQTYASGQKTENSLCPLHLSLKHRFQNQKSYQTNNSSYLEILFEEKDNVWLPVDKDEDG